MRKFPANLLLSFFLVISVAGFSQNSNPLSGTGKDSVAAAEKAKLPGDSTHPITNQPPPANRNNAGNINSTEKIHHVAMRKKELRKQKPVLPDSSDFIYDLNAFYSLGK